VSITILVTKRYPVKTETSVRLSDTQKIFPVFDLKIKEKGEIIMDEGTVLVLHEEEVVRSHIGTKFRNLTIFHFVLPVNYETFSMILLVNKAQTKLRILKNRFF